MNSIGCINTHTPHTNNNKKKVTNLREVGVHKKSWIEKKRKENDARTILVHEILKKIDKK